MFNAVYSVAYSAETTMPPIKCADNLPGKGAADKCIGITTP